jgi:cyclopropane fatty-acyl-phospholipid synthase-like methyltransferase
MKTKLDIRSILSYSSLYSLFQWLLGANKVRKTLAGHFIRPKKGNSILDIGCGPADILEYLNEVNYVGFDISEKYIETAKKRYKKRGTFICNPINKDTIKEFGQFDIVLAIGVLHHLNNNEVVELFSLAYNALKPNGRLITLDCCYVKNQSIIAKYIIGWDRGKHICSKEKYIELASMVFPNINSTQYNDLLLVPYTHIILECKK